MKRGNGGIPVVPYLAIANQHRGGDSEGEGDWGYIGTLRGTECFS